MNPGILLIVGLVTGIGGAVTYSVFHYAEKEGSNPVPRTENDLLPMPPDRGLPLPRILNIKWPWVKD